MFFFSAGAGGCRALVGPEWIFLSTRGGVARHVTIHISPDFAGVSRVRGKSNNHPCTTSPRWRGVEGWGVGGSRFAMYTEVHRKTGRARTDFLASKLPRAQEAPRCRDSFAGRRSPAGKIVPDSHSHGHPQVGCTLIVPSSIKWALLQSSYASPGSFSEIRDCENVHTCGCFTVTNFRE